MSPGATKTPTGSSPTTNASVNFHALTSPAKEKSEQLVKAVKIENPPLAPNTVYGCQPKNMDGFSPKSSMLIGLFIIKHPFWGTTIFGNTHIASCFKSDTVSILKMSLGMVLSSFCVF